jgi:hypothetical protein
VDDLVHGHLISPHARGEIARRRIDLSVVAQVIAAPEQRLVARPGREVLQSRLPMNGKTYIVRVFVDTDRSPPEVVAIYRTSELGKYWSSSS